MEASPHGEHGGHELEDVGEGVDAVVEQLADHTASPQSTRVSAVHVVHRVVEEGTRHTHQQTPRRPLRLTGCASYIHHSLFSIYHSSFQK